MSEIEKEVEKNRKILTEKKTQLSSGQELLYNVEKKFIRSEIDHDAYTRWGNKYKNNIQTLEIAIDRLKSDHGEAYKIFDKQLDVFTDLKSLFHQFDTMEKREFIDLVFDSNLYYENGIY